MSADGPPNGSRAAILALPVQIWLLALVVGALAGAGLWLGSVAWGQNMEKLKEVKDAATEAKKTAALVAENHKTEAMEMRDQIAEIKTQQAVGAYREYVTQAKMDRVLRELTGRIPHDLPSAEDFRPAAVEAVTNTSKDAGR